MKVSVAEREHTRRRLVEAAVMLAERDGYEAVSMTDIAKEAGLARSAIYNYASDKASLLEAAAEEAADVIREQIDSDDAARAHTPGERLDRVAWLLMGTLSTNFRAVLILQSVKYSLPPDRRQRAAAPLRRAVLSELRDILIAGSASGEFDSFNDVDLAVELAAAVLSFGVERAIDTPTSAGSTAQQVSLHIRRSWRPAGAR